MTAQYPWGEQPPPEQGDPPPAGYPPQPPQQPRGTWPQQPAGTYPPQPGGENQTQQLYLPPGFDTGQQGWDAGQQGWDGGRPGWDGGRQLPPGYGPGGPGYGQPGYGPPGYGPGGGSHTFRNVLISIIVVVVVLIGGAIVLIGRSLSAGPASSAGPAAPSTPAAPSAPASSAPPSSAPPAGAGVIATFSGSGPQTTAKFTVPASWALHWSYNCDSSGFSFGKLGFFDLSVNDPASSFPDVAAHPVLSDHKHGRGTIEVTNDAGVRSLRITTFCAWSVRVTG